MDPKNMTPHEAEYASYVDRGTQTILQDAVQKIVETFSHTDALEDIIGYLEGIRDNIHNQEERLKDMQQKEKLANDKLSAMESSVRNLLQRLQSLEVQVAKAGGHIEKFSADLTRLTTFFEKSPFKRLISRMESIAKTEEIPDEPATGPSTNGHS